MLILLAALALQSSVPPVEPAAPEQPKREKKQCRRMESTGSIMAKQTCHTKAEWAAIDRANAANTDQYHDRRQGTSAGGSAPGS